MLLAWVSFVGCWSTPCWRCCCSHGSSHSLSLCSSRASPTCMISKFWFADVRSFGFRQLSGWPYLQSLQFVLYKLLACHSCSHCNLVFTCNWLSCVKYLCSSICKSFSDDSKCDEFVRARVFDTELWVSVFSSSDPVMVSFSSVLHHFEPQAPVGRRRYAGA